MICLSAIACSVQTEIETNPEASLTKVDFTGSYLTEFNCEGDLSEANGEEIVIIITRAPGNDLYSIDLGDDVVFQGIQTDNLLVIEEQTLNEEFDFDVITLAGEQKKRE